MPGQGICTSFALDAALDAHALQTDCDRETLLQVDLVLPFDRIPPCSSPASKRPHLLSLVGNEHFNLLRHFPNNILPLIPQSKHPRPMIHPTGQVRLLYLPRHLVPRIQTSAAPDVLDILNRGDVVMRESSHPLHHILGILYNVCESELESRGRAEVGCGEVGSSGAADAEEVGWDPAF